MDSQTPELDELWKDIEKLGLERNIAELDAYGLTVVPPEKAAAPGFTDRLTTKIFELAETQAGGAPDLETGIDYANKFFPSLYFLLMKDRIFEEVVMNPISLTLVTYLVGESALLNFCGATLKGPGPDALPVHADTGFMPPPLPAYAQVANATWILSDYTKENGSLSWVPGSHKLCRQPLPGEAADKIIPLEAPAGSLAVWHGNTWHGAYPRTNPGLRVTLITSYFRMYMRTQELYREHVTQDMLDRNPPRFAKLMGQHVTFGWAHDGPDSSRAGRYPHRAGANVWS